MTFAETNDCQHDHTIVSLFYQLSTTSTNAFSEATKFTSEMTSFTFHEKYLKIYEP